MNKKLLQKTWQEPDYFLTFGFGTGLMPYAPGTWGTLAGVLMYLLIIGLPYEAYLLFTITAFILGTYLCNKVSVALGVHDYKGIVWDEVVGYLVTMFSAPFSWQWMIIGFILFRFFDIWKPQPIRWVDNHVKGGFGIMLDDVLAAIPAWLVMQLLIWRFQ